MKDFTKLFNAITDKLPVPRDVDLSNVEGSSLYGEEKLPFSSLLEFFDFLEENVTQILVIRSLRLGMNQLSAIPSFVFALHNLTLLDLSSNNIGVLSPAIAELEKLEQLNVANNKLSALPNEILELRKLKILQIYKNEIETIPENIHHLTNLEKLIAHYNRITEIPKNLLKLDHLNQIQFYDNPIKNVSGAIYTQGNGIDALRIYYKSVEKGSEWFFENKIIVCGDGEVGKTTLINNLIENYCTAAHPSTVGLDVIPMNFYSTKNEEHFKFHVWDFGGQGKYRTVQQLFCTPNAIYIYVTVPEKLKQPEKYGSHNYWLNFIEVASDKSPVIFVLNKIGNGQSDTTDIDQMSIRKNFPFVREFVKTEFNRNRRAEKARAELKAAIEICISDARKAAEEDSEARIQLERLGSTWIKVVGLINEERKKKDYISKARFIHICQQAELTDRKEIEVLLQYLNKSGAVLVYDTQKVAGFSFEIILNPSWIKLAVYAVLEYLMNAKKAWFVNEEMANVWPDYWERESYYFGLIELMKDLNFSFPIGHKNYIPSLLPSYEESAEKEMEEGSYAYEFHFQPYIPAGILHKLIANIIDQITLDEQVWENRFMFFWDNQNVKVEVQEYWETGRLIFYIYSASISVAKILSHELLKAKHEFEGRNHISEIDCEEWGRVLGKRMKKHHFFQREFIKDHFNLNVVEVVNKHVVIVNPTGDVIIEDGADLNMPLQPSPLADHLDLVFKKSAYDNPIALKSIWNAGNRFIYSTALGIKQAILLKNENWYQFYFNHQAEELHRLIMKLPTDSSQVKFAALPKVLWEQVKNKWPALHFINHNVYHFKRQALNNDYSVEVLLPTDIPYLLDHQPYLSEYGGEHYLAHRISQGFTAGIRQQGELVAWTLLHDDGTMGFLRVMPGYRQRNMATTVSAYLINKLIDNGLSAIAHVSQTNKNSICLAQKLGGQIVDEVAWARLYSAQEIAEFQAGEF